jgi:site-specific recombinase XerD
MFLRYIKHIKTGAGEGGLAGIKIGDVGAELLSGVTLSDVYGFLNYAMADRENSAKTRARKVSSIRSFFKYLTGKTGLLEENPVRELEIPASPKKTPVYLTLEESIELIKSVNTAFPERDFCIITLFLNCGMRLSELCGVNLGDIRGSTLKLMGKGRKQRIIYLNEACTRALEAHLATRPQPAPEADKNALFLSRRGTRLTPRRVEQIVEECLCAAGLSGQGYSPHKLRHTAATLMYQHGKVDIRVLKDMLGHVSLSTTEIYTHVADSQLEQAAAASPLSRVFARK